MAAKCASNSCSDVLFISMGSMYGVFTYVYGTTTKQLNVGKYTIHGSYGIGWLVVVCFFLILVFVV